MIIIIIIIIINVFKITQILLKKLAKNEGRFRNHSTYTPCITQHDYYHCYNQLGNTVLQKKSHSNVEY